MTFYVLLQHVQYEGSSLKGTFLSLDDTFDHIDQMDGYCMDEFTCDREDLDAIDEWSLEQVQNATAGWVVNGPSDLQFHIYACVIGA